MTDDPFVSPSEIKRIFNGPKKPSFAFDKKQCEHIFKTADGWTVPDTAWEGAFLVVAGNGLSHAFLECPECNSEAGPMTKSEVLARKPDAPIRRRNDNPECAHLLCKNTDTEWHHFAPVSLFPDADYWPMGSLCRAHHAEWHRRTQTGAYRVRTA